MKILIACEYSGIVRDAFLKKGHDVISCDILPTESEGPHYQGDLMDILDQKWDMIIGFPPCTDLSNAQSGKVMDKKIQEGKPQAALEFIKKIYNSAPMVCIENPLSWYLNDNWIPYTQIIEPYFFGHNYRKRTCLWLKNLPPLISTCYNYPYYKLVLSSNFKYKYKDQKKRGLFTDAKNRSKFHYLVAEAMANQWG